MKASELQAITFSESSMIGQLHVTLKEKGFTANRFTSGIHMIEARLIDGMWKYWIVGPSFPISDEPMLVQPGEPIEVDA
jgi:hypothetical protein